MVCERGKQKSEGNAARGHKNTPATQRQYLGERNEEIQRAPTGPRSAVPNDLERASEKLWREMRRTKIIVEVATEHRASETRKISANMKREEGDLERKRSTRPKNMEDNGKGREENLYTELQHYSYVVC